MTLGDLVMYMFFIAVLVMPVAQLATIGTQVADALAGLDRIRELLRNNVEATREDAGLALPKLNGDVVFEHIQFEYDEDVPVLRGVSLHAPAGTTTALVGPSGSGKSTIVSMVVGFIQPTTGNIRIDGHDLASVRLTDLRSQVGVVLQDSLLFAGTIRDNIRYARPNARTQDVEQAARIANAHDFIKGFPDGYEAVVGERGITLSGGQRQRIAIARAILADPKLLILDEATSSLDSESEALIQQGLNNLRKGRTTFVIAHRLSTIRSADQILLLEEGRIMERGTHEELLNRGGRYKDLHDRQFRYEANVFVNPGEDARPAIEPVTADDKPKPRQSLWPQ